MPKIKSLQSLSPSSSWTPMRLHAWRLWNAPLNISPSVGWLVTFEVRSKHSFHLQMLKGFLQKCYPKNMRCWTQKKKYYKGCLQQLYKTWRHPGTSRRSGKLQIYTSWNHPQLQEYKFMALEFKKWKSKRANLPIFLHVDLFFTTFLKTQTRWAPVIHGVPPISRLKQTLSENPCIFRTFPMSLHDLVTLAHVTPTPTESPQLILWFQAVDPPVPMDEILFKISWWSL